MDKVESQLTVVQDPVPTVNISTEKWPEDMRLQLKDLIAGLIPSAELNEDSVLIPENVLPTRVKLGQVLEAFLQLKGVNGELIFPGIETTLQQLRATLEETDLDGIKTVFKHVEGLDNVFGNSQNVEILSTIFAQGPVIKICENINRLYGETGGNDGKRILLKTNFPKVTDEFSDLISSEYNLKAKVEIPSGMNEGDEKILSNAYRTLFKLTTKSLNEQIKQGLMEKIDGCKIDEVGAILPFLGLNYNGITIHTEDHKSPFGIIIFVEKNGNTFKVKEIKIMEEDRDNDYAGVIKDRLNFLKAIANLSD